MATTALIFNPGSNSLKFELLELQPSQQTASDAKSLAQAAIDGIGKEPKLSVFHDDKQVSEERCDAPDMAKAVGAGLRWLRGQDEAKGLRELSFAGVRVVHGGNLYEGATRCTDEVRAGIASLRELAPLHNQSSLDILDVLGSELADAPAFVTFDTAFHRTLPEVAWRYPIEYDTANRHGVRKFGFHGLSHRYMLEQYAKTAGKEPAELSLVTLHLESGSSACAIAKGQSVDTTMGLTPLEGLMMGSRSGSIDPAIVPYLMHKEQKSADDVLTLLNKQSGLRGIAGGTLDTRELRERDDDRAELALAMFSYRVRLAVGAYLAVLGEVDAVIFGAGIGENSPWLRAEVCAGLRSWGLDFDEALNARSTVGQVKLSRPGSRFEVWSMPVAESKQIAHECALALAREQGES